MREDINKISYPSTLQEALAILPRLKAHFGNCEEYSFDINVQEESELRNISLLCDSDNETITIFHFIWAQDLDLENAKECVDVIHLDTKEAKRIAEMLNYFVTIIKNEQ
jgi:hypothetical protein